MIGVSGGGGQHKAWPMNHLSSVNMGSKELKWQSQGLQGSVPGPLHICMAVSLVFSVIPTSGSRCVFHSIPCSWDSSSRRVALCITGVRSFILSYYILCLSCLAVFLWRSALIWMQIEGPNPGKLKKGTRENGKRGNWSRCILWIKNLLSVKKEKRKKIKIHPPDNRFKKKKKP